MAAPRPALTGLVLSRSTLDRAAQRRSEPGLVEALLGKDDTRVLGLRDGTAPVLTGPGGPELALVTAPEWLAARLPVPWLFLGVDDDGAAHLAAHLPPGPGLPPGSQPGSQPGSPPGLDGAQWLGLREVGAVLGDRDAGLFTSALALSAWHANHPRCARCGAGSDVVQAGWVRKCPICSAEHYPRTDPAVIMAVTDADDRLLLGRQAVWPQHRFSVLAGFVEPGESLEAAVRREVLEESGVVVGEVDYAGSQPWPFPSSLMLGFRARAVGGQVQVDGDELAEAAWWTRDQVVAGLADGTLLLPGPVSIARRLIEDWFGAELTDGTETWR